MNCALVIRRLKDKTTGQSMRRAVTVEEISSDANPNAVSTWNPKSDYFEHKLEDSKNLKKISEQTGIDMDEVLKEHSRRTKILKWMSSNNVREHREVSEMIRKYYNDPKSVLKKINCNEDI